MIVFDWLVVVFFGLAILTLAIVIVGLVLSMRREFRRDREK